MTSDVAHLSIAEARERIAAAAPALLVTGVRADAVVEERDNWIGDAQIDRLSVTPDGTGGISRYRLVLARRATAPKEALATWRNFTERLQAIDHVLDGRLLLDFTAFTFDALLYLLRSLDRLGLAEFDYCYATPKSYDDDPILDRQFDIQQPKGYAELVEPDQVRKKLIFLGFDELRADRFIRTYDWQPQDLHFCVGDPGTIPDGFERSMNMLSDETRQLLQRRPEQMTRLDATDARRAEQLIFDFVRQQEHIDLVPIGPKPWTFAAASAYIKLKRDSRHHMAPMRILYDYGQRKRDRTRGIGKIVFGSWSLR